MSGASPWTTISEMELQAAVEALRSIPAGSHVELCSDSELLIHGMQFHVFRWQRQGWRNGRGFGRTNTPDSSQDIAQYQSFLVDYHFLPAEYDEFSPLYPATVNFRPECTTVDRSQVHVQAPQHFALDEFRQRRDFISIQLNELTKIARELEVEELVTELEKTQADIRNAVFHFVVVGEFSRGKSTIINALLGDKILPASVEPTTAVLTKLYGADQKTFKVRYRDDRPENEITFQQFRDLIAPVQPRRTDKEQCQRYEERLKEVRSIARIDISHPAGICKEGVDVIDTPGTNDLDPLREQITYEYIPRADAILFILSALQPLADSEVAFLVNRVLKTDVARIFFVLNFCDAKSGRELEDVKQYCLVNLAKIIEQPRLFPVSARKALAYRLESGELSPIKADESGFPALESALASFLQSERSHAKLSRPTQRGIRFCDELISGPLAITKSGIGLDIPELQKKITELTPKLNQLQEMRNTTIAKLRIRLDLKRDELAEVLQDDLREIATASLDAVNAYDGPMEDELLRRALEQCVGPLQSRLQTSFKTASVEAFSAEISRAGHDLSEMIAEMFSQNESDISVINLNLHVGSGESGNLPAIIPIGAIGVGFLFLPLPIAVPVVMFATWLFGKFEDFITGSSSRQTQLAQVRLFADERYRATIPSSVESFRENWKRNTEAALKELTDDFDRRCAEMQVCFKSALTQLQNATKSASERKSELNRIEARLLQIKHNLTRGH